MEIVGLSLAEEELNVRCLRIQVRVKGILEALISGTDNVQTPVTLFQFLNRLIREGRFIPNEYFTPVEKKRLTFDVNGRTMYPRFSSI